MAQKLKKFPKAPKESASIETWKKYGERVKEVKKFNDAIKKKQADKKKLIESIRKMRSAA